MPITLALHQHDTGLHDYPCAVCGRRLDNPTWWVHDWDPPDGIDMGWFPVGSECKRTAIEAGYDVAKDQA
jgi:hypothetical protein